MFDDVRKIIVAAAALLALLPTAGLVGGLVTFPPEFDRFLAFTVGVTGPVVVLICFALRRTISRLQTARIALAALTLAGGSWLAWEAYAYGKLHVIEIAIRNEESGAVETQRLVKPETPSGRLAHIIDQEFFGHWDEAIIDTDQGHEVRSLMREQSLSTQRNLTLMVNLAQALLIVSLLVAAFTVAEAMPRGRAPPQDDGTA